MPVPMRAQPSVSNDADTSGIVSNAGLYAMTANSASIPNNWWTYHHMLVNFGTTTQMTRWQPAYGRLINFQANAEL